MAEILLSLTIIGVVAAITLPSLTGNINERTWNTQRKALYSRMSQAIALMPALNGYGTLSEDASGSVTEDNVAETFVTSALSKVLKINNICDSEHLQDCGVPSKYTTLTGSAVSSFPSNLVGLNSLFNGSFLDTANSMMTYSQANTKAAAFETVNGESIVVYYNPKCKSMVDSSLNWVHTQPFMCANFVYDLNGVKGPNTVGKDIGFITVLNPTDSEVVAPIPLIQKLNKTKIPLQSAKAVCKSMDVEARIPNIHELAAMFYNRAFIGTSNETSHLWNTEVWSGSSRDNKAIVILFGSGQTELGNGGNAFVWCIKR